MNSNTLVIVDAGHGGIDSGAIGNGLKEKDLTLQAAIYMYNRLEELGIRAVMTRTDDEYLPKADAEVGERSLGVLVSMENGKATAYALGSLEERGVMFIEPGTEVYEGMIIGECNRDNDLAVNVTKGKNLTNVRAAGSDHTVVLKRPRPISLEYALDYINSDELVEVTPHFIRIRKRILNTEQRKKFDSRKEK